MAESDQSFDVVIIGAGMSGINAAYRIQTLCPGRTYTILEARDQMGGTWDLFKYPGIRSDSDLHTFGFPFRPWMQKDAIAEGPLIVEYMKDTAAEFGIDRWIQYGHKVDTANFSSKQQRWNLSVTANTSPTPKSIRCQFLLLCTGYYDYHKPLNVDIPGISSFKGPIIHPQFWPSKDQLDYTNKSIVVIGSGATAITLVPSMAKAASHVTMLQRSPSWIVAVPQNDFVSRTLRFLLPASWAARALRWRFLFLYMYSYTLFQRYPAFARSLLRGRAKALLPKGYPLDPHFNPAYNPWDQRLCASPDGDFFAAIRAGSADIVTDTIRTVTEEGIELASGATLRPDIIVTATGLRLQVAGGIRVSVDDVPVDPARKFVYRHAMVQDIPNALLFIGYVQYSWTLGADCSAQVACRLINHMAAKGYQSAVPRVKEELAEKPLLQLKSTYIKVGGGGLPMAGDRTPWAPRGSYVADLWEAKRGDWREVEFSRGM